MRRCKYILTLILNNLQQNHTSMEITFYNITIFYTDKRYLLTNN